MNVKIYSEVEMQVAELPKNEVEMNCFFFLNIFLILKVSNWVQSDEWDDCLGWITFYY